jgi:hypothetical protein
MFKAPAHMWRAALAVTAVAGGFAWAAPVSAADTFTPTEYQQYTGQVASFNDVCVSSSTCSAEHPTATISWGDGTSSGATLTKGSCSAGCTWSVSGSHLYKEEGTYTVAVAWSDSPNGFTQGATVNSTAQVADPKPVLNLASPSCPENGVYSGTVATFTDPGAGPASDFTATVRWWDGTTTQAVITARPSAPTDVSATHACSEAGSHSFTVTVNDEGGASSSASGALQVYDPQPQAAGNSFSAVEGQRVGQETLATFTDPGNGSASEFTATIGWGDGTTSTGSVQPSSGGGFAVLGSGHAYADDGSYQLTVTINDRDGSSVTVYPAATVSDAALTAAGGSLAGTVGQPVSGTIARFSDAGGGPESEFTATVHWGDGSTGAGTVVPDPVAGYDINASHTYAAPGNYDITISVADRGGSQATTDATAQVGVPSSAGESTSSAQESAGGSPAGAGGPSGGSVSSARGTACVVPKLLGKTLAQARTALARARCGVGKVTRRHARKQARRGIVSQGMRKGAHRAAGTRVPLVVGR